MGIETTHSHLLAGCDETQRLAITSPEVPLIVRAGAGSGKTRVLTRRVAWQLALGTADASHVLVATFTRKAAAELRHRLSALGASGPLTAGTFHAIALAELRRLAVDRGEALPIVLDRRARLVERVMTSAFADRLPARFGRSELLATLTGEIDWAKARLVAPEEYAVVALRAHRRSRLEAAFVAEVYAAYESEKRRRKVLDFDDLLARLTHELLIDPDLAAAERWRFRHFFVDELQDLTPAQLGLLDALLDGREDLFAVGDANQAIYGWNGALEGAFAELALRYPNATLLELEANYRSSPQLVAFSGGTFGAASTAPIACGNDGPLPTVTCFPSAEEEATGIANAISMARRRGFGLGDCAVLARTNAQLRILETALDVAGIARRKSLGAFLSDPEIARTLRRLRSITAPEKLLEHHAEMRQEATRNFQPDDAGRPALATLVELIGEYLLLDPLATGEGLATFISQSLATEPGPGETNAVDVLTFHRAKGLEWPVVFVAGLEDGLVPIAHARGDAALAEEQRLLYVALSRAARELHCSWASTRTFSGRSIARNRSSFLEGPLAVLSALAPSPSPEGIAASALAESRAHLRRHAAGDTHLSPRSRR